MAVSLLPGICLTVVKCPGEIVGIVEHGIFPGLGKYLGLTPLVLIPAENRRYSAKLIKYRAPSFAALLLSRSCGSDYPVKEISVLTNPDILRLVCALDEPGPYDIAAGIESADYGIALIACRMELYGSG